MDEGQKAIQLLLLVGAVIAIPFVLSLLIVCCLRNNKCCKLVTATAAERMPMLQA